ncbi:MAG: head-tail adaptor protein [Gammaproteobacteria bacterium]|nr:MAG: head-tail adaptor protein [Gammaproteobacteria bacterium]
MSAGGFRRRVDIYAQVRIDDGAGGYSEGWSLMDTRWGRLINLTARDRIEAMGRQLEVSARLRFRWRDDFPFPALLRIDGSYMLSVGPPVDIGDRRRYLEYDVRSIKEPVAILDPTPTATPQPTPTATE